MLTKDIHIPAGNDKQLYFKVEFDTELNVIMEKDASATLRIESDLDRETLVKAKMMMGESAKLVLEELHRGNLKMESEFVCNKNSSIKRTAANISSKNTTLSLDCSLHDEGAQFENQEVNFGTVKADSKNSIKVHHKASKTKSLVKVKNVMKDASKNLTQGRVLVEKGTKDVDTYLSTHTLLLDEDAAAEAIPSLEINTDDVQAAHAASVTTVDEEQLFYLTTRGISYDAAKKEIVKAFLLDVIDDKRIAQLVEEQWQKNLTA